MDAEQEEEQLRLIKETRISLMVVAVIIIISALFYWLSIESEIAKIKTNPLVGIDRDAAAGARIGIAGSFSFSLFAVDFMG